MLLVSGFRRVLYPGTIKCKRVGDNAMEIVIAVVIYLVIWTLVLWGSSMFNANIH